MLHFMDNTTGTLFDKAKIDQIIHELKTIIDNGIQLENQLQEKTDKIKSGYKASARNLLHYIALRSRDTKPIQHQLTAMGISSLKNSETHVHNNINAVLAILHRLTNHSFTFEKGPVTMEEGQQLKRKHINDLFGPNHHSRNVRIMVTMPYKASYDYEIVRDMIFAGMDCARINCAKDSKEVWMSMINNIRAAEKALGLPCKILMDLGGPKIRTGTIQPGPKMKIVHPQRDINGHLIKPVTILLGKEGHKPNIPADIFLPVDHDILNNAREGYFIRFKDSRNYERKMAITEIHAQAVYAEMDQGIFVETGTPLYLYDRNGTLITSGYAGELPHIEQELLLKEGDRLLLNKTKKEGHNAQYDEAGNLLQPAEISCLEPDIFKDVHANEKVIFDDGEIEGIIKANAGDHLDIEITHTKGKSSKLGQHKGINFPDSDIQPKSLMPKDLEDLDFICRHADIVNMSFVRSPHNVYQLQEELQKRNENHPGIMLKIETRQGINNLPWILLAAMRRYPAGIMIARGDLAVEVGWEKMARLQQEILWLCNAAHIPVVWATQVLEGMAKKGIPSRAELTDAAMSQKADCVMLNKGDYIIKTIEMLNNILKRMEDQEMKSSTILNNLTFSETFNI